MQLTTRSLLLKHKVKNMNRQLWALVLAVSSFSLIEMHPLLGTIFASVFMFELLRRNLGCVDFANDLLKLQWIVSWSFLPFSFYSTAYHFYWSKMPNNALTIFWFSSMLPLLTGIFIGANCYVYAFRELLLQMETKTQTGVSAESSIKISGDVYFCSLSLFSCHF